MGVRRSSAEMRSKGQQERINEQARTNEDRELNYQSFPDSDQAGGSPTQESDISDLRGFSSSINDMFVDPDNERVDCCALACCGVFQNDRDRYLITGIKPPSCCRRFWIHIVLPFWIFALAMFCAVRVKDAFLNELLSTGFVFVLFGYFIIQCMKGMWKRRNIRKELLWSKNNLKNTGFFRPRCDDDTVQEPEDGAPMAYLMGQTRWDIRNGHALLGCYAADRSRGEGVDASKMNFCSRFFQCFSNVCCGAVCGMQLQLCGVCAVAQEGRQLEKLIPSEYRRIDYVTMQPMLEYYHAIYEARNSDEDDISARSWFTFWGRLSNFSKWTLGILATILGVLLVWSLLGVHLHFRWLNYVVFCATLLQAYVVLKIVHWNHTKDISADALIKFFVSGFCLSTTLAVFFELIVGLSVRLTMTILMAISGINVVESDGYSLMTPGFANGYSMQEAGDSSTYRDYLKVYGKDNPIVYTIYLFVNAFFLAAMIEESCKYFGFRMIEHPDFLSRRALEDAVDAENQNEEEEQRRSDFSRQERSLESRGAAITVAMVAAALGFACCENLVYIFIYGGSSLDVEVVILLARSIFPVHPIAAALQSIRVCERDLEKMDKMTLGRVILPGVLFHGFFDFLLMWVDFLASRKGSYVDDDDAAMEPDQESDWLSFVFSFFLMIAALLYYFREAGRQRSRLRAMDHASSVDHSRLL